MRCKRVFDRCIDDEKRKVQKGRKRKGKIVLDKELIVCSDSISFTVPMIINEE